MANFGTDSTQTAHDGRRSINLTMICGGLFGASAGTLDSVSIFGDEDGGGFNNYRLAVYQGGTSDTDPAGATLVWDSGEQTCPAGAAAWRTVAAASQALAASTRTWVAVRTGDEFHPHYCILADEDDATYNAYTWASNNSATAFEATVPAVSLDGTASFKWYLTFTVGGASTYVPPPWQRGPTGTMLVS